MKLLIVISLLISTTSIAQDDASARFICRDIPGREGVKRCENAEVYCYLTAKGGIWCQEKGIRICK